MGSLDDALMLAQELALSGETGYGNDVDSADRSKISNEWLQANIRKGPLG